VREDLAKWQKLNVTAFLTSGVVADAGAKVVGEPYEDADGCRYLPMLRQPVLVFAATRDKLATVARRARERDVPVAIYTADLSRRAETRTIAPRSRRWRRTSSSSSGLRWARRISAQTLCCAASGATTRFCAGQTCARRQRRIAR
jgi:Protein of unknown function (DUF2000)